MFHRATKQNPHNINQIIKENLFVSLGALTLSKSVTPKLGV